MPHEYTAFLVGVRTDAGAARRRAVGPLPRRLGLAVANSIRRRAGRRAAGRVRRQRDRRACGNAALEEIIMLIATRQAELGVHTGAVTKEIARTSRIVSRLTGYPVQRTRRSSAATRSRTIGHSTRTACSRSAAPSRSWTRQRSASTPTSWCWASTRAPRAAAGAERARLRGLGPDVNQAFKRFKEIADKKKQVPPWTSRRC